MGFLKDLFKMDPEVDFQMGLRAETFESNHKKAAWLYGKAAEQNHPKAQFFLSLMHLKGRGVGKDFQKAFELATKSASQGYYKGQYLLAQMYLRGVGVQRNLDEGNFWMAKFNAQGQDASKLSFIDFELKSQCRDDFQPTPKSEDPKIIIDCPKCFQKLRIPSGRRLRVTCSTCAHVFEV